MVINMKKLRLGVVGLHFGRVLIEEEIVAGPGAEFFELAAVCDQRESILRECACNYEVAGYSSIEEMLEKETLDCVALMTGPGGRAKLMDLILDTGTAVVTTKPFENSAKEAERILQKSEKTGVPIFINSPEPVPFEDIALMLNWREKYHLGALVGYHACTWAGYREQADGSWYDDPFLCPAAPLFRLGIYSINNLGWFTEEVKEVKVMESRILTGRPTADNAQMSIYHSDGCLGSIYASFCIHDTEPYRDALELRFENGVMRREILTEDGKVGSRIEVSLVTHSRDRTLRLHTDMPRYGRGYRWETMYQILMKTPEIKVTVSSGQIVKGVRLLELVREASIAGRIN